MASLSDSDPPRARVGDPGVRLLDDPSRADVQVADLGVSHLAPPEAPRAGRGRRVDRSRRARSRCRTSACRPPRPRRVPPADLGSTVSPSSPSPAPPPRPHPSRMMSAVSIPLVPGGGVTTLRSGRPSRGERRRSGENDRPREGDWSVTGESAFSVSDANHTLMDSAVLLDLLGNENRRRILRLLATKPCYVTEIRSTST